MPDVVFEEVFEITDTRWSAEVLAKYPLSPPRVSERPPISET